MLKRHSTSESLDGDHAKRNNACRKIWTVYSFLT